MRLPIVFAFIAVIPACDTAAILGNRDNHATEDYLAQQEADRQRRQAEFSAKQEAARQQAEQQQKDAAAKRAADEKDRRDAEAKQAEAAAKTHRDECAATYRDRFIQLQKDAAEYVALKPKVTVRCKELAKHCSTSSSGQSYCHGITGQEHQAFDQWCSGQTLPMTHPEDEECSDVDPEHLSFDFSWPIPNAQAFVNRKPPVAPTKITASDSTP